MQIAGRFAPVQGRNQSSLRSKRARVATQPPRRATSGTRSRCRVRARPGHLAGAAVPLVWRPWPPRRTTRCRTAWVGRSPTSCRPAGAVTTPVGLGSARMADRPASRGHDGFDAVRRTRLLASEGRETRTRTGLPPWRGQELSSLADAPPSDRPRHAGHAAAKGRPRRVRTPWVRPPNSPR